MYGLRRQHHYDLNNIGAIDEIPLYCHMSSNTTPDRANIRSVPVNSTGHDKTMRITICLATKAIGAKLKPMIVFKGVYEDLALN